MFLVIPAIDVRSGRAVRLYEGDPEREKVYFADPLDAARHWTSLGAGMLHLVDLDATLERGVNTDVIAGIAGAVDASIEVGGGVRSMDDAERWLQIVHRVIVGTLAVRRPDIVAAMVERFGPDRIAVSVDARGRRVAVRGWAEATAIDALDLAKSMSQRGITNLIYTDIDRDGTMRGVDPEPVAAMRDAFGGNLVAGGGVAGDADLDLYEQLGLQGAIVGRALYEGKISYPRTA